MARFGRLSAPLSETSRRPRLQCQRAVPVPSARACGPRSSSRDRWFRGASMCLQACGRSRPRPQARDSVAHQATPARSSLRVPRHHSPKLRRWRSWPLRDPQRFVSTSKTHYRRRTRADDRASSIGQRRSSRYGALRDILASAPVEKLGGSAGPQRRTATPIRDACVRPFSRTLLGRLLRFTPLTLRGWGD